MTRRLSRVAFFALLIGCLSSWVLSTTWLGPASSPRVLVGGGPSCPELLRLAASLANRLGSEALTLPVSGALPAAPPWLDHDWAAFLLGLSDDELAHAEVHGLRALLRQEQVTGTDRVAGPVPPNSLREFIFALESIEAQILPPPPELPASQQVRAFGMSEQKARQVTSCVEAVRSWFDVEDIRRVVDIGAGRGALTREFRSRFGRPCLGLELDANKVSVAQRWADRVGESEVHFSVCNVRDAGDLIGQLRKGDLLIGLHPCGSLGEDIISAVAKVAPELGVSLLMVSCCLQGRPWAPVEEIRVPCSRLGRQLGLTLPRDALKKTNLWGPGTAPLERVRMRLALRWLLAARGFEEPCTSLTPSMRGLRRSDLLKGLRGGLAARALEIRGLREPSLSELDEAEVFAESSMPAYLRLELLTTVIGDVVELLVNLDRTCALEEAGLEAAIGRLFPRTTSPRNLAVHAKTARLDPVDHLGVGMTWTQEPMTPEGGGIA